MPHLQLADILAASDAGTPVADIAAAHHLSASQVYAILREHRPDRPRKVRRQSSARRQLVLGLLARGYGIERVAELAQCSKAWVYRIGAER